MKYNNYQVGKTSNSCYFTKNQQFTYKNIKMSIAQKRLFYFYFL